MTELRARTPGSKRYASSTDVAKLAGVSQSAVSRTYKSGASVSDETRLKVLAAAAQLGYRPSMIPQIMLTHRSNLVAVVVGGLYKPFYAKTLERFTTGLQELGHQTLLVHANSGHTLDGAISTLASYRVDAIVSALAILSPEAVRELSLLNIPIISFNTQVHNAWISSVCCDNVAAGRSVADLLVERGGRSFGFVCGPPGSPASEERQQGFTEQLTSYGFEKPRLGWGDFRYEGGMNAGLAILKGADRPDAIFCGNDLMALGLVDAARHRLGLRVPDDVMVVGFDDIPQSSWAGYQLTTVIQDDALMTNHALRIVTRAMELHSGAGNERVVVTPNIVERATVRPARSPAQSRTRQGPLGAGDRRA
jgi:DNA-binding LacI/PurR family transcriptional regulator